MQVPSEKGVQKINNALSGRIKKGFSKKPRANQSRQGDFQRNQTGKKEEERDGLFSLKMKRRKAAHEKGGCHASRKKIKSKFIPPPRKKN